MTSLNVDRNGMLPLYRQGVEKLRAAILRGEYLPGKKIPPERELCHLLGVSRITVIKALNKLADDGLLVKRVGLGTFVADTPKSRGPKGCALGFVAPLLRGDTFFNDIVIGAESAVSDHEISLILGYSKHTAHGEWRCIERLKKQRVAGLILFMTEPTASWENVRRFTEDGSPVVLIDHRAPMLDELIDTVTSDNLKGAFLAVQHLIRLGHRRIALQTQSKRLSSIIDREEGYRLALLDAGIPFDPALIRTSNEPADTHGHHTALHCLALEKAPTALFAINDALAIASMKAFATHGIRIPEQFSVVGFDDNFYAPHALPPLTTVRQQREAAGRLAVNLLFARLENPTSLPRHETLDVELVIRGSAGPVPAGVVAT